MASILLRSTVVERIAHRLGVPVARVACEILPQLPVKPVNHHFIMQINTRKILESQSVVSRKVATRDTSTVPELNINIVSEVTPYFPGGGFVRENFNVIEFAVPSDEIATESYKDLFIESNGIENDNALPSLITPYIDKQRIVVEFSSPNIAKPFHVGHLRSTIIGNALSNLNQAIGHNVTRINYLGDWGMQLGILLYGYAKYGNTDEFEAFPIKHLFNIYVKAYGESQHIETVAEEAKNYFIKLVNGDPEMRKLWEGFKELSVAEYGKLYERLGVRFDEYSGESLYDSAAIELVKYFDSQSQLLYDGDGSATLQLNAVGGTINPTVCRDNGMSLYLTRDVAAARDRFNRLNFDRMLYVVDQSQAEHFQNLFLSLKLLGEEWWSRCEHITFGKIRGMSTRLGTVVFLADVLEEAKERALNIINMKSTTKVNFSEVEEAAERLATSAIILFDLKHGRNKNYAFDWEAALTFADYSGVTLQYTHARIHNLLLYNDFDPSSVPEGLTFVTPEELSLLFYLSFYETYVVRSGLFSDPAQLARYLTYLCKLINRFYREVKIRDSPDPLKRSRLVLLNRAVSVLAGGMKILGIVPLNKL